MTDDEKQEERRLETRQLEEQENVQHALEVLLASGYSFEDIQRCLTEMDEREREQEQTDREEHGRNQQESNG